MGPHLGGKRLSRGILLVVLLMLFSSDSIVFSKSHVSAYYSFNRTYLYSAARFGLPDANFQAYQTTQNKDFLLAAARANHAESAFLLYQILNEKNSSQADVWLTQAVHLGVGQAIVERLRLLVKRKEWQTAELFITQYSKSQIGKGGLLQEEFEQLKESVKVALSDVYEIESSTVTVLQKEFQPEFYTLPEQCSVVTDVIVANEALQRSTQNLLKNFSDSLMAKLGVCFNDVRIESKLSSICHIDAYERIDCDLSKLAILQHQGLQQSAQANPFSHLLVVVDKGEANTRGGLMFLDKHDGLAVLQHEIAHWFGYVDEYRVNPIQQKQLCQPDDVNWIGPNVVTAPKRMSKALIQRRLNMDVYSTHTCDGSDVQAYKVYADNSFMEFLDLPVSQAYLDLLATFGEQHQFVPAAMNFALAFKGQDLSTLSDDALDKQVMYYQFWLTEATKYKFPPALRMLAQLKIEQGKYVDAQRLLVQAAEWNDPTSQLLLGHSYLEGSWLPRDLASSAFWYQKAAQNGDSYGLYFYGKCFEMGWGCVKSVEKATDLYQAAAKKGNELAIKKLATDFDSKRGKYSQ